MLEFAYLLLFLLVIAAGMLLYQIMTKVNYTPYNLGSYATLFMQDMHKDSIKGGSSDIYIIDFANLYMKVINDVFKSAIYNSINFRILDKYRYKVLYLIFLELMKGINISCQNKKTIKLCVSHTNILEGMRIDYINICDYLEKKVSLSDINDKMLIDNDYPNALCDLYQKYINDYINDCQNETNNLVIEVHLAYAPFVYCVDLYFSPNDFEKRKVAAIPNNLSNNFIFIAYAEDEKYKKFAHDIPLYNKHINPDNKTYSDMRISSFNSHKVNIDEYKNIIKGMISRDDFLCIYLKAKHKDNSILYSNDQYRDIKYIIDYILSFNYKIITYNNVSNLKDYKININEINEVCSGFNKDIINRKGINEVPNYNSTIDKLKSGANALIDTYFDFNSYQSPN